MKNTFEKLSGSDDYEGKERDKALSRNHDKKVRYRLRKQAEREAEEEIEQYLDEDENRL